MTPQNQSKLWKWTLPPSPPPPQAKWPVPLRVINNQPLEIFLHVCVPLEFWNPTFCITNWTKIILNKSIILRTAPWQSPPFPWLPLTNKGLWYYNRYAYFRRNVALFSPWPEQQSETTYIERPNNIFVKQTQNSWSRSLPNTTASSWNP